MFNNPLMTPPLMTPFNSFSEHVKSANLSWGPAARKILDAVTRHASATSTEEPETVSLHIAQRLSCSFHRENARAVLRRLAVWDDGMELEQVRQQDWPP